jgi:hypothetical protein
MILEEKQKKSRKHLFLATDPASRARFVAKICPEQTLSRSNVLCIVEPQYSVRDNVVKSNGKKVILGRHLTVSFFFENHRGVYRLPGKLDPTGT